MKIEVLHSLWGADEHVFEGGEHEILKPSKRLLALIAGGAHAGAVRVVDATAAEQKALDSHIQTQDAGEAAYAAAVAKGRWHHGNLLQFVIDREDRLAYDDTLKHNHPDRLDRVVRMRLEHELRVVKARLEATEVPT